MDNQKNMTYLIDMVKQIHETTLSLDQKIDARYDALDQKIDTRCDALDQKIDERYDALDQKIDARCDALDARCDALDQKIDTRCDALDARCDSLDAKIDKYYEENRKEHFEMRNMLAHIQNDIKDLRTDIDTVYDLERDSRKQLRKLF